MITRTGVYPGTFDPITRGHMDIIRRGAKLVDRLVIGVTTNPSKSPMFTIDERLAMVKREVAGIEGEILVVLMIEDLMGIENLEEMLTRVKGIGAVLIGEGDLSQELGFPREYEHPEVVEKMAEIVRICKAHNVPVGHPHVGSKNVEAVIAKGFNILLASPVRSFAALDAGRKLAGRT